MGLIRILLFVFAAIAIYAVFKRIFSSNPLRPSGEDFMKDDRLGRLVQDLNCGVYVDSKEAVQRKVPDGVLFFCSKDCANAYFEKSRHGS